jgi:hypothetical protein
MDTGLHMMAVVFGMEGSWRDTGIMCVQTPQMNLVHGSLEYKFTRPKEAKLIANSPSSLVMVSCLLPM